MAIVTVADATVTKRVLIQDLWAAKGTETTQPHVHRKEETKSYYFFPLGYLVEEYCTLRIFARCAAITF